MCVVDIHRRIGQPNLSPCAVPNKHTEVPGCQGCICPFLMPWPSLVRVEKFHCGSEYSLLKPHPAEAEVYAFHHGYTAGKPFLSLSLRLEMISGVA